MENFVREAELQPVDAFRDSALLKVNTVETRGRYQDGRWTDVPLALAFLKVICPSTQKAYFLRMEPDVENAKQALESTLTGTTAIGGGSRSGNVNRYADPISPSPQRQVS